MSLYKHVKVEDAVKEHAELMSKLRQDCKEDIAKDPEQFNDDLFLVKFCLSHKGDVEKTKTALKASIDFRVKHKDMLAKLATGWRHPSEIKLNRYSPACRHGATNDGSPLFIVEGGRANLDLTVENCTEEEITDAIVYGKEFVYQQCIEETKKRGYIVKMITIQNSKYSSTWADFNRKFLGILGNASKSMELVYPQLVGAVVLTNPLPIINALISFCKFIMSESMMSKIKICGAKSTVTGDIGTCPIAGQIFNLDNLPSNLGGKCKCEDKGGCFSNDIFNLPNDRKEKICEDDFKNAGKKL